MFEIAVYLAFFLLFAGLYVRLYNSKTPWQQLSRRDMGSFVCPPAFGYATLYSVYEGLGGKVNFFTIFTLFMVLFFGPYVLIQKFKYRNTKKRLK